jgi:hypothetical protein
VSCSRWRELQLQQNFGLIVNGHPARVSRRDFACISMLVQRQLHFSLLIVQHFYSLFACARRLTELSAIPDCGHLITSEQPLAAALIVNKVL